ncbi:BMP family ABC transporter substrate-binding protein [Evansella cellulosilytica]|uniref:Basic membrane lipoprotein n=1 Tax=Evansella cellulosilytica (strain ATCC 21833 / DSM 2522 / FERM P-1141 / JCM 9156 / N-4) TaxID=649639 RepID=E6TSZ9_EVAC2|nr:BMP family ABC transporter substrate-binding protein [Evansella cellulosilytica]ADU31907.1 basic membrane lipoprotein [Evansella cellulosilytica DSM 2522]
MQQSRQLRTIFLLTIIVASIFIALLVFQIAKISLSSKDSDVETKVTIITSDEIVDQSWGSLAFKGKIEIEKQFPVNVTLFSEINTEQLKRETIDNSVSEGTTLIIGHGREFSEVFTEAAQAYPETHFVTIHGYSEHENQSVYTFEQGDVEYFAGLVATLFTESNSVAVLDSFEARDRNPQFEKGLNYYDPDIRFFYEAVGSRDDGEVAVNLMDDLLQKGVDVFYAKGNAFNRDVIEYAKKQDVYVIGYLDDQSYLAKDHVLTSVLNNVPKAYVAILDDFFREDGIPAGETILTEEHGVYQLAPFGPMFSDEEIEFIEDEMLKFQLGELNF